MATKIGIANFAFDASDDVEGHAQKPTGDSGPTESVACNNAASHHRHSVLHGAPAGQAHGPSHKRADRHGGGHSPRFRLLDHEHYPPPCARNVVPQETSDSVVPVVPGDRLCGETVGHVGLVGPSAHEELSKVLVGGFHQRGGAAIGAGVDVGAGANRELHAGLASYVGG